MRPQATFKFTQALALLFEHTHSLAVLLRHTCAYKQCVQVTAAIQPSTVLVPVRVPFQGFGAQRYKDLLYPRVRRLHDY